MDESPFFLRFLFFSLPLFFPYPLFYPLNFFLQVKSYNEDTWCSCFKVFYKCTVLLHKYSDVNAICIHTLYIQLNHKFRKCQSLLSVMNPHKIPPYFTLLLKELNSSFYYKSYPVSSLLLSTSFSCATYRPSSLVSLSNLNCI